jgi:hypothetical protein
MGQAEHIVFFSTPPFFFFSFVTYNLTLKIRVGCPSELLVNYETVLFIMTGTTSDFMIYILVLIIDSVQLKYYYA